MHLINKTDTEKIKNEGHEIGSHTHTHKTLKNINRVYKDFNRF